MRAGLRLLLPPCGLLPLDLGAAFCADCVVQRRNESVHQDTDFFRRVGCCRCFCDTPLAIPGSDGEAGSFDQRSYQSCMFRLWFEVSGFTSLELRILLKRLLLLYTLLC